MPPNDLTKSIKSLQSFKELFVDRKRISMGHIIMEGEGVGEEREREAINLGTSKLKKQ